MKRSSKLAAPVYERLKADIFEFRLMPGTRLALDFNKPTQRWLDRMTLAEAKKHQADDQFDQGSMGPKIAALIDFVGGGGRMGLITDGPNLTRALRGETGTRIVAK